jgi:hypothetical protein
LERQSVFWRECRAMQDCQAPGLIRIRHAPWRMRAHAFALIVRINELVHRRTAAMDDSLERR